MTISVWRNLRLILADTIIFITGIFVGIIVHKATHLSYLLSLFFFLQLALWIVVSALFMKYSARPRLGISRMSWILFLCNLIILLIGTFGFRFFIPDGHPANRFFLYAVIVSTSLEWVFFSFYQSYLKAKPTSLWESEEGVIAADDAGFPVSDKKAEAPVKPVAASSQHKELSPELTALIIQEIGKNAFDRLSVYLNHYIDPLLVVSTTTRFNISSQPLSSYGTIINLRVINDIRYVNKFFEAVNGKLQHEGLFIGRAEDYSTRKRRIMKYYPMVIRHIVYIFDYLFNRVFSKLPVTKQIYFFLTKGHARLISRTETLGRLYSCGFEVVEEMSVDDIFYFVVRRIREPFFDTDPTYGAFIKLSRVGKNGKIIGVYKLRTMHPYSEYLQPYIYEKHKLKEGGKFHNDFRVTTIGAIARKFWIDEIPMVINLIRGEIKLVGVRTLSRHFFSLYTPELQQKRIKHNPGLIPPYYADMPKTLEEVMKSEMKYLEEYEKSPLWTDIKYFFRALWQIIFKLARSG